MAEARDLLLTCAMIVKKKADKLGLARMTVEDEKLLETARKLASKLNDGAPSSADGSVPC